MRKAVNPDPKAHKLLGTQNAKTTHGEDLGVLTGILYLNPKMSRAKLCPYSSDDCFKLCLVSAGRGIMAPVIESRARKTDYFLNDRKAFIDQLREEIKALVKRAKRKNLKLAIRLNGTSDILWEKLSTLIQEFPDVQFYDYTKIPIRYRGKLANYHLTFSYSGDNWSDCVEALNAGVNVAVVFAGDIPTVWRNRPVIDGTTHDARFLDNIQGGFVGLCTKGNEAKRLAKAFNFIVNY